MKILTESNERTFKILVIFMKNIQIITDQNIPRYNAIKISELSYLQLQFIIVQKFFSIRIHICSSKQRKVTLFM